MSFFNKWFLRHKKGDEGAASTCEELLLLKRHALWRYLLFSFTGGLLFAAALPPLNFSFAAFAALAPLVWCAARLDWKRAAFCGWVWGLGWSLFAFQFLREIELPVPYMLAPVLSLWPAVSGGMISLAARGILYSPEERSKEYEERKDYFRCRLPWYRTLLFILSAAVIYTLVEWTRSRLFTWNDLSVTQWRNLPFVQIASVTGSYGVLFLVALTGAALGSLSLRWGKLCFLGILLLPGANGIWGVWHMKYAPRSSDSIWNPALIQGDLSQRRHAGEKEFREAMTTYIRLSREAAKLAPSVIIWPESAVPMPLRSAHPFSLEFAGSFKELIADCQTPMLIGALDFAPPRPGETVYGVTNSALFFDSNARLCYKYDKIHRVPYGEYIPFRKYLPEFIINMVDMGRDLTPGINREVLEFPNGPRLSTAICYEGVFGYLTRDFARRGSEMLVVLSNDAWYPRSSEPEQHLANALLRAVETGLPMLRCGNNGGSGVVTPEGRLLNFLDVPQAGARIEIKRGQAAGIVQVPYKKSPELTFYVKHGEWFIALLTGIFAILGIYAFINHLNYCKKLPESNSVIKK